MTASLASAILLVYNGARRLRAALDSVVGQDYRPLEVMVVDDGSTDESAVIARSYPDLIHIHQPNASVATARNTALRRASGEYFAFLDQDDQWTPDKLRRQADFLLLRHVHEGNDSRRSGISRRDMLRAALDPSRHRRAAAGS